MKRRFDSWRSGLLAIAVVAAGGCTFAIDYRPMPNAPTAPASMPSVALRVRNNRPEDHGGLTERIGTIYDSTSGLNGQNFQYHGRAIKTTSPAVISETVGAATTDALAHAGISVEAARPVLVASVMQYWFDGAPVHTVEIIVAYDLLDGAGRPLWHTQVRGYANATILLGSALVNMFRDALQAAALQASDAFRSPEFVTRLRSAS